MRHAGGERETRGGGTGDTPGRGVLILAPAAMPKAPSAELLPAALVEALREHTAEHLDVERIRLRVAMHVLDLHNVPDLTAALDAIGLDTDVDIRFFA